MVVNVTGVAGAFGIATAMDTLCSQAHGAKNSKRVFLIMLKGIVLMSLYMALISPLWIFSGKILALCGIDPAVCEHCTTFTRIFLAGGLPMFWSEALRRVLFATGHAVVPMCATFIALGSTVLMDWLFTSPRVLDLGFVGIPMALSVSYGINLIFLLIFTLLTRARVDVIALERNTLRELFFSEWKEVMRLAIPGYLMICASWWGYEILAVIAGLLGVVELSVYTVLYNILTLMWTVPMSVGVVSGICVGNNLGAQKPILAKFVSRFLLVLSYSCTAIELATAFFLRYQLAALFTMGDNITGSQSSISSSNIREDLVEKAIIASFPFMILLELFDGMQVFIGGTLRGCGLQLYGAACNVICFYVIGIPLACVLAFVVEFGIDSVFVGLAAGVFCQWLSFLTRLFLIKWDAIAEKASKLAKQGLEDYVNITEKSKQAEEEQTKESIELETIS
ncbi:solute carrier family 47 [Pelomyxa schiedti]|nr:solute carrier family 47 [Pelomyxa schiedti]